MALSIPCANTNVLSIDAYVEHVTKNVRLEDVDSIAVSAPALRALANDRTLVVTRLNERIKSFLSTGEIASPQAILLGKGKNFYVRASIWPAISDMANARTYQDQFAYNLAHDHNFTFMTVTHLGPGYETELYEYDYNSVEGYIGESVDLRFVEKIKFTPGNVMLYRAGRDVHVQLPPPELTITLNLMISLPEVQLRDQFYFDVAKRAISAYPQNLPATGRVSLIRLAGLIGDEDTQQIVGDLARQHPCRRTRLTAYEALAQLAPTQFGHVWGMARSDPEPLIANAAKQRLSQTPT